MLKVSHLHGLSAALFVLLLLPIGPAVAAPAREFGANVALRGSLENARIKFEREKKGTVAFMGGSITEMNGYRPMVCEILQKRFPQTNFKFIAAGVSSTTSTTGAFRLEKEVLDLGPIDLFFVEFAVNDDQDGHNTRAECIRAMEGIIRHVRRANPNADIVMTFFVNEAMLQTLQSARTPLTIEAHGVVAEHYKVSTINLAKEAAERISAGALTWKQYGGVHPAPFGNAIGARMIDQLFDEAWSEPLAKESALEPHAMPDPIDPLNYERGRFIDPATAKIANGWTLEIPDWKKLPGGKRSRFTSIPMLCATEPGAEMTLAFQGSAVGAYVVAGPDAGILEASIDGGAFSSVNLLHEYSKGLHYPRTVMFAEDLKPGDHALTLRVASETHGSGHAARIMEFVAN